MPSPTIQQALEATLTLRFTLDSQTAAEVVIRRLTAESKVFCVVPLSDDRWAIFSRPDEPMPLLYAIALEDGGLRCPDCGAENAWKQADWVPRTFDADTYVKAGVVDASSGCQEVHWDGCSECVLCCASCGREALKPSGWALTMDEGSPFDADQEGGAS